jgi:hypothetical protein
MPKPVNPTTDAAPDEQRRSNFAALMNAHTPAEAPTPSPALASAAAAAAVTAVNPSPPRQRARRVSDEDEAAASGRTKFTVYIHSERKIEFENLAENTFFDTRGDVSKSDVHDAIVAYGLAHAGEIVAELIRSKSAG